MIRPSVQIRQGPPVVHDLVQLLAACEDVYPGIDLWLKRTAVPGVLAGDRVGLVAYSGPEPIGAALVRLDSPKLCSLRVVNEWKNQGVGVRLFHAAAAAIEPVGDRFHFTAPESLSLDMEGYFARLGFLGPDRINRSYRRGDGERLFVGLARTVRRRAAAILEVSMAKHSRGGGWVVLSVRPRFARAIACGAKTVEIRRRFSSRLAGARAVIYATAPEQAVIGTARIESVETVSRGELVERCSIAAGCSREELLAYSRGAECMQVLHLADVRRLDVPLGRADLERSLVAELVAPQSHLIAREGTPWRRVAEMVELLQRAPVAVARNVQAGA